MHIIWVEREEQNDREQVGGSRLEITEPLLIVGFKTELFYYRVEADIAQLLSWRCPALASSLLGLQV